MSVFLRTHLTTPACGSSDGTKSGRNPPEALPPAIGAIASGYARCDARKRCDLHPVDRGAPVRIHDRLTMVAAAAALIFFAGGAQAAAQRDQAVYRAVEASRPARSRCSSASSISTPE